MNLKTAISATFAIFKLRAKLANRATWQGVSVRDKPEMRTHEYLYHYIDAILGSEDLEGYRKMVAPNVPWADNHFEERVSGNPLNPGDEWRHWPWGHSADKFRISPDTVRDPTPEPVFDHTYAQRYWPKHAGRHPAGILPQEKLLFAPNRGIYFDYGDLNDVVEELYHDPGTRQAILPVFFPEDTGYRPGRRKPCSLSYQFQLSGRGSMDVVYYIRSCDIVRHFRDDIYLTVRLLLWVLEALRARSRQWYSVKPGRFIMHIGNLHCFVNDWRTL